MDIMGRFSNPQVLEGWEHLARRKRLRRHAPTPQLAPKGAARPYGYVKRLVIQVLQETKHPVTPAQVQQVIARTTGEVVPRSSIKYCLWSGSRRPTGVFIRDATGYRLR